MSDLPPSDSKSSRPLLAVVAVLLIIMAAVAGLYNYKYDQATTQIAAISTERDAATVENAQDKEQIATLTGQLEDAQKEISELQPLANKARTMPIALRIDRHALNAGYNLFVYNRARISLRFHYTINGNEVHAGKGARPVIDGGRFAIIPGLASGDVVKIDSEGYDDRTITIQ
jgi:hypothetical protein